MYGLKQAPGALYVKIDTYLIRQGLMKSPTKASSTSRKMGGWSCVNNHFLCECYGTQRHKCIENCIFKAELGSAFDMQTWALGGPIRAER